MTAVPTISVILPTRNRADRVAAACERLFSQDAGGRVCYELIVVDNGSTDGTKQILERVLDQAVPARYVFEPRAGIPVALNAGIAAARGEILAFTDDDILLPPDWLVTMWRAFSDPSIDGVAGRVLPRWVGQRPAWLDGTALRLLGLGCVDHGAQPRRSTGGFDCRWVGGNMAVRRRVFDRLGGFDVRLLRDQDTEYYERCRRAGLQILYEPAVTVEHSIGGERLTLDYFRMWHHRAGYYRAFLLPWKPWHVVTVWPVWRYLRLALWCVRWVAARWREGSWWERFYLELRIREEASLWWHRIRLIPRGGR